jgi:hypothetical protein
MLQNGTVVKKKKLKFYLHLKLIGKYNIFNISATKAKIF